MALAYEKDEIMVPKTNCFKRKSIYKSIENLRSLLLKILFLLPFMGSVNVLAFQQASSPQLPQVQVVQPTNAYECTQVAIEDIDPNLLTKEERIALLDGSLQDSIDQYSTCVSTVQQSMSGGGGGTAGGSGDGDEGAQSNGSANEEGENDAQAPQTNENQGAQPPSNSDTSEPTQAVKNITPAQRGVIPPKDNDKIICKLLFNEINSIDDPDMLKGLKEQYETYKCG